MKSPKNPKRRKNPSTTTIKTKMNNNETICSLILLAASKNLLKKAVFSKPTDQSTVKAVATLKLIGGDKVIQAEQFTKDNKALHKNIKLTGSDENSELLEFISGFMQINLITTVGECEYRVSRSANSTVIGGDKLRRALEAQTSGDSIGSNNKQKDRILKGDEPFLKLLEISDKNGRIHDKKQAKYRQINRFLEHIRDILKFLPEGDIRICDLCCGKSYLSFAVYHYFANVLERRVYMTGIDLKKDVIEYCSDVASRLGFDGLEFICGDINEYETEKKPDLVISLHACDIATDIVLEKATAWETPVILSTPCCHHELNHKLSCPPLQFIADYSMLRQKLCDAATDAMRLKRLEAFGYSTDALELIDPEDTPKNIMLRAIKKKKISKETLNKAFEEYLAIRKFLMGDNDTKSDQNPYCGECTK